jgi:hypothetical protein
MLKKMIAISAMALTATYPLVGYGALQTTTTTYITSIGSYAALGGGDVIVSVSNLATNCGGGFWLKPGDGGTDRTLSTLLSAYHAHSHVQITGYDNDLWPGSGSPFCRIYAVSIVP